MNERELTAQEVEDALAELTSRLRTRTTITRALTAGALVAGTAIVLFARSRSA